MAHGTRVRRVRSKSKARIQISKTSGRAHRATILVSHGNMRVARTQAALFICGLILSTLQSTALARSYVSESLQGVHVRRLAKRTPRRSLPRPRVALRPE